MTSRDRWLAALNCQPVDRLPFWPKIFGAYPLAQVPPFSGMTPRELHQWIGSDQHEFIPDSTRERRTTTACEQVRDAQYQRTTFCTPRGEALLLEQWDTPSQSWHPVQHPVTNLETIRLMTEFYEDESWEFDAGKHAKAVALQHEIGERALVATGVGESPLMFFIEYLAGLETAQLLLQDYQDEVEALFAAMHASLLRKTEVNAASSNADAFYFTENTSTTLISPTQFQTYCLPFLRAYAGLMRAAGKTVILHMCGHLKKLLPDLATLPVQAFEAFTTPGVGNTTLCDGRLACPDVCLIGGTNATLWTRPASEIIGQLERDLDALPHLRGLVITSAGVMPPLATPQTIRTVCEWVQAFKG